jgi:hypothetical protein
MSRANRQEHAVRTRITLPVPTRMRLHKLATRSCYILATSDLLLALHRASPMASQAEGRGFETRRPLSWGCSDLHGFTGSRRRIGLLTRRTASVAEGQAAWLRSRLPTYVGGTGDSGYILATSGAQRALRGMPLPNERPAVAGRALISGYSDSWLTAAQS